MSDANDPRSGLAETETSATMSAWSQMTPLIIHEPLTAEGGTADDLTDPDADPSAQAFEALADPSVLPVTVYPFLRQVSDRMAKELAQELRKRSGTLVDVAVVDQVHLRMGSAISVIPVPSLIGVMMNDTPDSFVFCVVDGAMAALYFDLLLGGAQIRSNLVIPARNFSVIEIRLFNPLVESVAVASNLAFEPLAPVTLKLDRVETNPRFLPVTKSQDSVIKIRFLVQAGSRSGFVDCYLTARFLLPIDARLRPSAKIDVPVSDPHWQQHLRRELLKSHVELKANLSDVTIPLYRLRNLKAGDVLPLEKGPDSLIELLIDKRVMARGRMGRSTGKIAVRIEERLKGHIAQGD